MTGRVEIGKCVTMPIFVKISRTMAEIWRFNDFAKWQLSAILDF